MAVELAEEDRCKAAFATPVGLFQFKRMPFGLKGAPMSTLRVGMAVLKHVVRWLTRCRALGCPGPWSPLNVMLSYSAATAHGFGAGCDGGVC